MQRKLQNFFSVDIRYEPLGNSFRLLTSSVGKAVITFYLFVVSFPLPQSRYSIVYMTRLIFRDGAFVECSSQNQHRCPGDLIGAV